MTLRRRVSRIPPRPCSTPHEQTHTYSGTNKTQCHPSARPRVAESSRLVSIEPVNCTVGCVCAARRKQLQEVAVCTCTDVGVQWRLQALLCEQRWRGLELSCLFHPERRGGFRAHGIHHDTAHARSSSGAILLMRNQPINRRPHDACAMIQARCNVSLQLLYGAICYSHLGQRPNHCEATGGRAHSTISTPMPSSSSSSSMNSLSSSIARHAAAIRFACELIAVLAAQHEQAMRRPF